MYEYKTNSIIGYFYRADFIIVEKEKWRTNKLTNEIVYGYQCYNQVNNGSIKNRTRYGLDTEGYCDIPMIGEWKLHFIAKTILESKSSR